MTVLSKRQYNKGKTSGTQLLIHWAGMSEDLATWEDEHEIKAKFPGAPAWGQACSEERGNVTLVENSPFVPVRKGLLSRSRNRDNGGGAKGGTFCPRRLTSRDIKSTTWPPRGAQGSPPFVPAVNTDRDKRSSTWRTLDAAPLGFRGRSAGFRGRSAGVQPPPPFIPFFSFQKNFHIFVRYYTFAHYIR